jgi:hypothetical protein
MLSVVVMAMTISSVGLVMTPSMVLPPSMVVMAMTISIVVMAMAPSMVMAPMTTSSAGLVMILSMVVMAMTPSMVRVFTLTLAMKSLVMTLPLEALAKT